MTVKHVPCLKVGKTKKGQTEFTVTEVTDFTPFYRFDVTCSTTFRPGNGDHQW